MVVMDVGNDATMIGWEMAIDALEVIMVVCVVMMAATKITTKLSNW